MNDENYSEIKSNNDLSSVNNKDTVLVKGLLQKWTPWSNGKGGGYQFFKHEIVFSDSTKLPLVNNIVVDSFFIDKHINIKGVVVLKSIHDRPCPPYCQNTAAFWQLKSIIEIQLDI